MDPDYKIIPLKSPDWDLIGGGISDFNAQQAGDDSGTYICFAVQSPGGEAVGGLIGVVHYAWLLIQLMYLPEDLRGQGYGSRLLALAEDEARQRGAAHAYLDTFSFQALEFYRKHGYQVFGELQDFPKGHTRYFMTKNL